MGATARSTEPQCWYPSTSLSPAPDESKMTPLTSPALPRADERHHSCSDADPGVSHKEQRLPEAVFRSEGPHTLLGTKSWLPQREGSTSPAGLGCAGGVWDAAAPGARDAELCTQTPFPNSPPRPCLCSPGCSRLVINHPLRLKSQQAQIEP